METWRIDKEKEKRDVFISARSREADIGMDPYLGV